MVKFEYKVISILSLSEKKINEMLNEYGIQGWELVHVEGAWHYFKRPLDFNEL